MQHNHYPKRNNTKKILLSTLLLVLFVILGFKYFYKSSFSAPNDTKVVATTTPVVSKPKPPKTFGISIAPNLVHQGEPVLITAETVTSIISVKSFTFNNRPLAMFIYDGQVTALLGVDLNSSAGTFPLVLTLHDGRQVSKDLVVEQRTVILNPFEIPDSLGGNTPQGIKQLISTLALEGKTINAIPTDGKKLWTEKFRYPLNSPIVVADPYGYTRVISNFTMPHKGTDFEAPIGTPVYAMNRGVVRFTDTLRNYGKTILIDHGIGLQTVYMHLSEISVTNGQMVEKGELIGLSGDTGYVLGPHLHLTVRIWDISIDSIKFLDLLGEVN